MFNESLDDVAILHLTHFTHTHTCCVVSKPPTIGIARGEGVAFAIQHSLDNWEEEAQDNVLGGDFWGGRGCTNSTLQKDFDWFEHLQKEYFHLQQKQLKHFEAPKAAKSLCSFSHRNYIN